MNPSSDSSPGFDARGLCALLEGLSEAAFDDLPFGVIGFDSDCIVRSYNRTESQAARLAVSDVIGCHLFEDIAQCMNNFMVAERFVAAAKSGKDLDETIDYTLSWRMRPTAVRLRMLSAPTVALRYIALHRTG